MTVLKSDNVQYKCFLKFAPASLCLLLAVTGCAPDQTTQKPASDSATPETSNQKPFGHSLKQYKIKEQGDENRKQEENEEMDLPAPEPESPRVQDAPSAAATLSRALAMALEAGADEFDFSVEERTGNHVHGVIDFPGHTGRHMDFLAVKTREGWRVVYTGSGVMVCDELEPYDFPDDMIKDCEPYF